MNTSKRTHTPSHTQHKRVEKTPKTNNVQSSHHGDKKSKKRKSNDKLKKYPKKAKSAVDNDTKTVKKIKLSEKKDKAPQKVNKKIKPADPRATSLVKIEATCEKTPVRKRGCDLSMFDPVGIDDWSRTDNITIVGGSKVLRHVSTDQISPKKKDVPKPKDSCNSSTKTKSKSSVEDKPAKISKNEQGDLKLKQNLKHKPNKVELKKNTRDKHNHKKDSDTESSRGRGIVVTRNEPKQMESNQTLKKKRDETILGMIVDHDGKEIEKVEILDTKQVAQHDNEIPANTVEMDSFARAVMDCEKDFTKHKNDLIIMLFKRLNDVAPGFNFKNMISVEWSRKLTYLFGTCEEHTVEETNGERGCTVVLSSQLVNSCKILCQTLIHQMCHTAVFLVNGTVEEDRHGPLWRSWMQKAVDHYSGLDEPFAPCRQYNYPNLRFEHFCISCGNYFENRKKIWERCIYCFQKPGILLTDGDPNTDIPEGTDASLVRFRLFVDWNYEDMKKSFPNDDRKFIMARLAQIFEQEENLV